MQNIYGSGVAMSRTMESVFSKEEKWQERYDKFNTGNPGKEKVSECVQKREIYFNHKEIVAGDLSKDCQVVFGWDAKGKPVIETNNAEALTARMCSLGLAPLPKETCKRLASLYKSMAYLVAEGAPDYWGVEDG